jgi:hypothetical protein
VNTYYVSLNRFLCGSYIKVKTDDLVKVSDVRRWATENLGKLWCDVYAENDVNLRQIQLDIVGKTVILTKDNGFVYDNY